jgi:PAS domain S-box-containing protein
VLRKRRGQPTQLVTYQLRSKAFSLCPEAQIDPLFLAFAGTLGQTASHHEHLFNGTSNYLMQDPNSIQPSNPNTVSKAAGLLVAAIGVIVLVGWMLDFDLLKRGHPSFVAMNPVTAICLCLSGVAMVLLTGANLSKAKRSAAYAMATIVVGVGVIKLCGYMLGIPIRLDAILFRMELREVTLKIPNQIAPNTALNFVLTGLGLFTLNAQSRAFLISNALGVCVATLSLFTLIGYAYGVTQFTQLSPVFIPMSLPTAAGFFLLAVGILCGRPDSPLRKMLAMRDSARVIAIRLFPAATLFIILVGWLRLYGERRQYFPGVLGTALFVVVIVLVLTALVWWTASTTGKIEADRAAAHTKLAESTATLEESHRHLQLIMNHASELICSLDRHTRFLSANESAGAVLGHPPAQLLRQPLADFIHPEDRDKAVATLRAACVSPGSVAATFRCRRGKDTYVEVSWSFQWAPYHETLFAVGRTPDVTSLRAYAHG